MRAIKEFLKSELVKRGRHLAWVPVESVTGFDLTHDLALLLPQEAPIVFDVGGNVGQSVEHFLATLKRPLIYSFEPSSACYRELSTKYQPRGVKTRQCALGAEPGTCTLDIYEFAVLNSILPMDHSEVNRFRDRKPIGQETVPLETLDRLAAEYAVPQIDLLKVDTQGFDLEVLKGAASLLAQRKVGLVQIELNFLQMYQNQAAADAVTKFLVDNSFALVDYYEIYRQDQVIAWCTALFKLRPC
jgi:FkbM family methyltransferase